MKKEICSTQDYLVSGETFSILWDESKGYAATHPQPHTDKLGSYYESEAYISHNESQQSVVGFLYRFARKYMFRIKHNMFKKLLPGDATILDYGCGTGGFLEYTSSKSYKSFGVETNANARDQAIGKNLTCIFVNNGLLRKNEEIEVINTFKKKLKINLIYVNAQKEFIKKLINVSDPEKKRKIIGNLFIKIFERYAKKIKNVKFLAQGTLYPDLIESKSVTGSQTSKIKSHHNVGGLPKRMKLKLVEPLKFLFKDEVRKLGLELKLSKDIISRHPFPGPGLAIRMPGKITIEKIKILKEADFYFIKALQDHGLYHKIWQAYAALLPVKTVGVMGDNRTYEHICLLRAITSEDGMTADFFDFPKGFMRSISNQIINNISGINRVVYDVTSKPPSTIELE